MTFEEVTHSACKRNEQVKRYLGDKLKMQDNMKLRPVLDMLLNHTSIKQIQQKPVVLQWIDNAGIIVYDNAPNTEDDSPSNDGPGNNTVRRPLYDVYDAYDMERDNIEKNLSSKSERMSQKNDNLRDSADNTQPCSELSTSSTEASYTSYASDSTTNTMPLSAGKNSFTASYPIEDCSSSTMSKEALEEWYENECKKIKPIDPSYFAFTGYRCYYCNFETGGKGSKTRYESHVKDKHGKEEDYPPYPNKADIERLELKAQGKDWET